MKTNNNILRFLLGLTAVVPCVLAILSSCSVTKYVGEDEVLLDKLTINGATGKLNRDEMLGYVRQQPNVRMLGIWRLGLGVYNLSGRRDNGWNRWLRSIGSAPVIYDSLAVGHGREQLKLYADGKGYFDSVVTDTVVYNGDRRCHVIYNIIPGEVYRVSRLGYHVDDDSLRAIVMADTSQCLIRPGDPFDSNVHDDERARILRLMQENGYYHFGKESVCYIADSTLGHHQIADSMIVLRDLDTQTKLTTLPHRKSVIDTVRFNVSYTEADSLVRRNGKPIFSHDLLDNSCFIHRGDEYRLTDIELTQHRFNSLPLFSSVGIRVTPKPDVDSLKFTREYRHLDCDVNLVVGHLQSYNVSVEGTNSSGNLGGAVSVGYKHNNFLHSAEVFDIKCRFSAQDQFARDGKERFFTLESGVEASVTVPNMVFPFVSHDFNRRRNPRTTFTIAYDYQRRPDFTKSASVGKVNYSWSGSKYTSHSFTPIGISVINIPSISDNFRDYINGTYLQYSYQNHFIMSLNYTFLFNQQKTRKIGSAWYVRFSGETAGNLLSAIMDDKEKTSDGSRHVFGISYSQYVKTDLELRFQQSDFWDNHVVMRFYGGVGVPYGNSHTLPFEKSYFVGGANSIRAWPVRGLGPGSSQSDSKLRYHNQIGDVRLEMNFEYRFKMVSMLEGALFADAGNIWSLKRSTDKPEAIIGSDFYKQVALGAGLGFRLNFDYFIVRIDGASKLHDPSYAERRGWRIAHEHYSWSKINWNFAIGYPF